MQRHHRRGGAVAIHAHCVDSTRLSGDAKGYDALVVVGPLLLQVLDEAGDFPMELHHHPAQEQVFKMAESTGIYCQRFIT